MKTITWLSPTDPPDRFPPADQALDEPPGLLAAGGDLSPARLLAAYQRGIFPWYSEGQPVLWWSPDPRAVLFPAEFHCSRSLRRTLRRSSYERVVDRDFRTIIEQCAAPRDRASGTWITPEMLAAYCELHRLGFAHSIEVYRENHLVGGLYGVRLGGLFFAESMFSREPDGSKLALHYLAALCPINGIMLIDCQLPSPHLHTLGVRELPRSEFQRQLDQYASLAPMPLRALQS